MRKIVSFLLLITSVIVMSSCISTKKVCKNHPLLPSDTINKVEKILNYTMLLPGNWEQNSYRNKDWYYIKGEKIDSDGYYNSIADVFINEDKVRNKCKNQINIEDYLNLFVKKKSYWGERNFKYLLLTSNHRKYGKVYILKYDNNLNNLIYSNSIFLFFHNNTGYTIDYRADKEYFDKYLPDVEKMVNSFTIDE